MVSMYYFGYEREVNMKKRIFTVVLCLSASVLACYADDFNNVLRGIRNSIDTLSDVNRFRGQVIQNNAQGKQLQQKMQQQNTTPAQMSQPTQKTTSTVQNEILVTDNEPEQIDEIPQKNVEVNFYGGLKPESTVLDVINTFKKNEGVTSIKLGYRSNPGTGGGYFMPLKVNGSEVNLKTTYCDKATLTKYLQSLIPIGNYAQTITLPNGITSKMVHADGYVLELQINKIYINSIPMTVEVLFRPSSGYYCFNTDKVLKGANGIAYPYLIETITMKTNQYDNLSQSLVYKYGKSVIDSYVEKYSMDRNNSCYEGNICNDFVALDKTADSITITYKNYTYKNELTKRYEELETNRTTKQTQKFNSINDI